MNTATTIALTLAFGSVATIPKPMSVQDPAQPSKATLTLDQRAVDMAFLIKNYQGYIPHSVQLVKEKPAAIVKEPKYRSTPLYGAFVCGNGPKSVTFFAVDEPEGQVGKIYIDKNQDGDLTNDGPGDWDKSSENNGIKNYEGVFTLHASWGSPLAETEGGNYTLFVYKRHGDDRLGFTKFTARAGTAHIGAKDYKVLLTENGGDAVFTVPKATDRTRGPVNLYIDLDGDGLFQGAKVTANGKPAMVAEQYNLSRPVQIDGKWYDITPNLSGSELLFTETTPPGEAGGDQGVPKEAVKLIKNGTMAPNFTAYAPNGKPIHLADFKGKVVLLDFWATWCGPCQASMPGLQKIYNQVRSQGVVVLSVNVFDAKSPFDAWIKKNSGTTYNFTFAFDRAGHDGKTSIAEHQYGVDGIPTLFVIDRTGRIKESIIGSGNETAITKALTNLGLKCK